MASCRDCGVYVSCSCTLIEGRCSGCHMRYHAIQENSIVQIPSMTTSINTSLMSNSKKRLESLRQVVSHISNLSNGTT